VSSTLGLSAPFRNLQAALLIGDATLIAFVAVQLMDGTLTYIGVQVFGVPVEANPIVLWYIEAFGAAQGLLLTKCLAVGCAMILHQTARHRTLALLTFVYLGGAVVPWVAVLTSAGSFPPLL
jgi:hypothetical protein